MEKLELVVKVQYLSFMKEKTKCYREQNNQQQAIVVTQTTIVHPCPDFMLVKYVHDIPKGVCDINQ